MMIFGSILKHNNFLLLQELVLQSFKSIKIILLGLFLRLGQKLIKLHSFNMLKPSQLFLKPPRNFPNSLFLFINETIPKLVHFLFVLYLFHFSEHIQLVVEDFHLLLFVGLNLFYQLGQFLGIVVVLGLLLLLEVVCSLFVGLLEVFYLLVVELFLLALLLFQFLGIFLQLFTYYLLLQ